MAESRQLREIQNFLIDGVDNLLLLISVFATAVNDDVWGQLIQGDDTPMARLQLISLVIKFSPQYHSHT